MALKIVSTAALALVLLMPELLATAAATSCLFMVVLPPLQVQTKMKRPVRLLGRATLNPKVLQNPYGSLGNSELECRTSTGEPTNTLNSTMTLANKFRRPNPNSIHTPVEHGDNRRFGRANGRRLKKRRRGRKAAQRLVACIG